MTDYDMIPHQFGSPSEEPYWRAAEALRRIRRENPPLLDVAAVARVLAHHVYSDRELPDGGRLLDAILDEEEAGRG